MYNKFLAPDSSVATSTKHFSDGREPVKTVERRERELTEDEIRERHLDQEATRLYEEQRRRSGVVPEVRERQERRCPNELISFPTTSQ